MKDIYLLRSENLTHLGGPMGTEYTYDNWTLYFSSVAKAKKYAERDYQNHTQTKDKLDWKKNGGRLTTGDLRFVAYHIIPVEVTE